MDNSDATVPRDLSVEEGAGRVRLSSVKARSVKRAGGVDQQKVYLGSRFGRMVSRHTMGRYLCTRGSIVGW